MKQGALTIAFVVACLLAFVWWSRPIAVEVHSNQVLTVDENTRTYRLVVPRQLPDLPSIVFAFHGKGDSPEAMAAYSQLDRVASEEGFLIVYPAGMNGDWTISTSTDMETDPDVKFFDRLLDHITSIHAIDLSRVYVVGFSNGAAFARRLSYARPDTIAAVVAHSGPYIPQLSPPTNAPPIMMLVGREDFFAESGEAVAKALREEGQDVQFILIPDLGHQWSASHNTEMWQFLSRWSLAM